MSYTHRTILVPAGYQQMAQALCAAAAEGDAGEGMFTTGLSATGESPITHYISAGHIYQEFADLLPLTTITQSETEGDPPVESTRPGNVAVIEGVAAQAGLSVPEGVIGAMLAAVDVTELEPFAALDRLGLKLVQEQIE